MKLARVAHTSLLVLLGLVVAGLATRVGTRFSGFRAELSRVKRTSISDELGAKLDSLRDDVFLTYYVTRADAMPSHLRHVEPEVVDLLRALASRAKGRLDWRLVDPTNDDDLEKFAARRKVARVRVRSVAHDQYSEQEVWSTLSIAYGPKPPALVEGIGPEHLPRLQQIVLEQLKQLENPRKPIFAIAAPREDTSAFRADLARRGELREVDLEHGQEIPRDADVLFVVSPRSVDATTLRRLRHFQETGGNIVVVGALHDAKIDSTNSRLDVKPGPEAVDTLLKEFGVRVVPGLLLDRKSATQSLPTGEAGSIFRVACLTLNQDFQSLARDPRGTILFVAANPLQLDAERLDDLGMRADVLATSSDDSALLPISGPVVLDATAVATAGEPVPKQPLLVWVRPNERWKGTLVAASSPSLVSDLHYSVDQIANARTIETLIETLTASDRLVMRRAGVVKPPPLPDLGAGSRAFWRFVVVLLVPLLVALIASARTLRNRASDAVTAAHRGRGVRLVLRAAGGIAVVAIVAAVSGRLRAEIDFTAGGVNALAAHAAKVARETDREVEVKVCFSADARLPPQLKPHVRELRESLRRFASAGAELAVESVDPNDLDAAAQEALRVRGVAPQRASSRFEETTTVRTFHASVLLHGYDRDVVLRFADPEDFENAEFRLALALWRLRTGEQVRIGFASDVPRLSAGEAWQFYQQRGLIPPSGKDVYSLAREILERNDFEVVHINPRAPEIPSDIDALFWLQPRRSVVPMLEKFVDFMYRGGHAFVAAQHFSMQGRQYRGRDLDFVYWPQPQSPDIEEFWYPELGIKMVREVLFDRNSFPVELDTQLHRSGRREFEAQQLAKTFCIRANAANFDRDSAITRTLGDQPFLFGAFFRLDAAKLAASGLAARPLMRTSEQAWSFDWKGGWVPPGMLAGPGAIPRSDLHGEDKDVVPENYLVGRAPLALLVEGSFPWPKQAFEFPPVTIGADGTTIDKPERAPFALPEPTVSARPGRLVLVGESEMFKDSWLLQLRPTFRADQFLLNAAADLALGEDFANVMAHRPVHQGFERVSPELIVSWRALVVFGLPLLIVLLALLRALVEPIQARHDAIRLGGSS